MNNQTLEKLHYNKLKEELKSYCVSGLGKDIVDRLKPMTGLQGIKKTLNDTTEARTLLDQSYHIPLEGIFNIKPLIEKTEKGMILEPGDFLMITDFLRGCKKVRSFFYNKENICPNLASYSLNIAELEEIEEEINFAIKGNSVDSNASKQLKKTRRLIEECEGKIKEKLEKFLKNGLNKEFIQEFYVSQKDGRYTIPIKAAYKNQVQGNIIETSSRGTTVFLEPQTISKYTQELEVLKIEEKIEEYRILSELTELINQRLNELKLNIEIISEYDFIWAKGKYSSHIQGIEPSINTVGRIKLVNCKYPLIKSAIPLNFTIGIDYRSLIITGPNAGGKTVVLMSLGLITLMVQSGLHICGSKESEIGIFENIFVDIGDNQSVENALSTFSSHVKNLAEILKQSNKSTLLLLDEIGSGTEPTEGAALAIAILEEFYHKGCITVATTHYGEIKDFSNDHPDFENAAMEFDKDTLDPKYKMIIGQVGESNAFYISKKMGISDKIIEKSQEYRNRKNYNLDRLKVNKMSQEKLQTMEEYQEFAVGDRIKLLDKDDMAVVYKNKDKENNIQVFYKQEFITVNVKRVKLLEMAENLYPPEYDLNQIFIEYKERKEEHDIERGSKKALKRISKEMKLNRKQRS